MLTGHLFAGGGGGLYADIILGHRSVFAVEWDAYSCAILRSRALEGWFPGLQVHECDIRMWDPSEYAGQVDCIHAGFPCQDISAAGSGKGIHGERSGLYREVLRIAGIIRPRFLFLENSPVILSRGLGTVLGDLARIGYDAKWTILAASEIGAPHQRDRWWCLCTHTHYARQSANERQGQTRDNLGRICESMANPNGESRERNGAALSENGGETICGWPSLLGRCGSIMANPIGGGFQCDGKSGFVASSAGTYESEENKRERIRDAFGNSSQDQPGSGHGTGNIPVTGGQGLEKRDGTEREWPYAAITGNDWWNIEPGLGRLAHGMAYRNDQIKCLGNGQVPLCAAAAWKILGGP
jgi:DNA (cytosine-5)-methyltransferase 1